MTTATIKIEAMDRVMGSLLYQTNLMRHLGNLTYPTSMSDVFNAVSAANEDTAREIQQKYDHRVESLLKQYETLNETTAF